MKKDEYKKKVKYLQELIGKLNYIKSRRRIDLEFPVSKIARLVLYQHKKVFEIIEKLLITKITGYRKDKNNVNY